MVFIRLSPPWKAFRISFLTLINISLDRNAKGDYDYINNINKPLKRR